MGDSSNSGRGSRLHLKRRINTHYKEKVFSQHLEVFNLYRVPLLSLDSSGSMVISRTISTHAVLCSLKMFSHSLSYISKNLMCTVTRCSHPVLDNNFVSHNYPHITDEKIVEKSNAVTHPVPRALKG